MRSGDDEFEPDERERLIIQRAERNGYLFLSGGLVYLMWVVFAPLTPMQVANSIIAIICLGEVVKIVSGLFYLRTGQV